MGSVKNYFSLVKFSHTVFALPFALVGFCLAVVHTANDFEFWRLVGVILCMIFGRNAAMAFNRYADRKIDALNQRTATRDIPSGKINAKNALLFVVINSVLFVICAGILNMLCLALSPIALLVILGYSYTKRFTALCHLVLGIGLALAPVGAYLAVTGQFDFTVILFGLVVLFWVSGFDIIYALQDASFDRENRLHSIPATLGVKRALQVSTLLHLVTAAILIYLAMSFSFGTLYQIGTGLFILLLAYQHTLVKHNDLSKIGLAFFTTNGVGSVIFGIFTICDLLL